MAIIDGKLKKFSPEERAKLLEEFRRSGESIQGFASRVGISKVTLHRWLRGRSSAGPAAVDHKGKKPVPYSPEQRRQAVEAFLKSGMSREDFAKVWGVGCSSLHTWVKVYSEQGPQALENPILALDAGKRGRKPVAEAIRQEIAQAKLENPYFGLKKVRDLLVRFRGVRVSTGTIRKTIREENLPSLPPEKKHPKRHPVVQRFERARPMQMWQTDITSFVLTRHSQRVYLTVFMDDCSRYIVSWNLQSRQTSDLVVDSLLNGIQRFGKP